MACIAELSLRVPDRPAFPPNEGRAADLALPYRHARTGRPPGVDFLHDEHDAVPKADVQSEQKEGKQ